MNKLELPPYDPTEECHRCGAVDPAQYSIKLLKDQSYVITQCNKCPDAHVFDRDVCKFCGCTRLSEVAICQPRVC